MLCLPYQFSFQCTGLLHYNLCTLAKSRDGAGSGTGTGLGPATSFPFQDQQGEMPSVLEAIPTGLIKELMMASVSFGGVLIRHVQ